MTAADLATAGFVDERFRYLVALVERLVPAPAEVVLYSVPQLAEVLSVDVGTVRRWLKVGKPDPKDPYNRERNIRLQAFYFNSEARIPWPALLAYDAGRRFDLATLPAPTAAPPKVGTVAPVPQRPGGAGEEPHLRVAS
jgi:hypothetical protein